MVHTKTSKVLEELHEDHPQLLGLSLGSHSSIKPGEHITKADAHALPQLFIDGARASSANISTDKKYIVLSLDIDAPYPSFNVFSPILHWCQSGLRPVSQGYNPDIYQFETTEKYIVDHIPPAPAPGSWPHRYLFLLYEEPAGFDVRVHAPRDGENGIGVWGQVRCDLEALEKRLGIEGAALAFNYYTCN